MFWLLSSSVAARAFPSIVRVYPTEHPWEAGSSGKEMVTGISWAVVAPVLGWAKTMVGPRASCQTVMLPLMAVLDASSVMLSLMMFSVSLFWEERRETFAVKVLLPWLMVEE